MKSVQDRFLSYVTINTQSSHDSETFPSTSIQLDLAKLLVAECKSIGLSEVELDSYGYVTATLPATDASKPTIGFLAHMDTAPDASGLGVSPIVHVNYNGEDIKLNESITLSTEEFPSLKCYKGKTLITTSGNTLLGADDKAGIAEILTAMEYLISHKEILHGKIKIAFTPDEEVGKGVNHFNVEKFGADFAYTIDGGELGELEFENFNAARAKMKITGKSVHPGSAKGIMKNAGLIALDIVNMFPELEIPARTEGYEGFYHLTKITAEVESAKLDYIIRCFDLDEFKQRKDFVYDVVDKINEEYGSNTVELNLYDEYFNMKEKVDEHPHVIELAKKAYDAADVIPLIVPIRGGTDGARLSFMGLPCPNIFTGGHNFHGPYEYIAVESMEKTVEVIVNICKLS